MEKMTYEMAREYQIQRKQWEKVSAEKYWFRSKWEIAEGFVEGWESRQAEVDELKKEVQELKNRPQHRYNGERVWTI